MIIRAQNRSEYEKIISVLVNPKTPAEWALAIQNPHSFIYKLMLDMTMEQIAENKILEILLERWIEIKEKENQEQIEQMIRDQIAAATLVEKKMQEAAAQTSLFMTDAELNQMHLTALRKMVKEIPILIASLRADVIVLRNGIKDINKKINKMSKESDVIRAGILDSINKQVHAEKVQVTLADGQVMSQRQVETWLVQPVNFAPMDVVISLLLKETPDIFSEGLFDGAMIARKGNVEQQFIKYMELSKHPVTGECDTASALKFIKINTVLGEIWREVSNKQVNKLANRINMLHKLLPHRNQQNNHLENSEKEIQKLENLLGRANRLIETLSMNPTHKNK